MSQDFNKGKIYKITNDYNDEIYIGSTCDTLNRRFSCHKRDFKSEQCKNRPLYKLMNEIGFERFRIELIEEYTCQDKYQLRQREGHFIRELGTLNILITGRSRPESQKEYREANKDKIKEQQKEYYEVNKDKICEHQKARIKERVLCECGCSINRGSISHHKKSMKHIAYQNKN